MSEKVSEFRWTSQKEQAAQLLADDQLSDQQIAHEVGVVDRTIWRWKVEPEFRGRVDSIVAAARAQLAEEGISLKVNRVRAMDRRHRLLEQVMDERATDPLMQEVPGGKTGLMVAEPMLVKAYSVEVGYSGVEREGLEPLKESQLVYRYAVDTGVLKELRDLEKQAAQELGQWVEKSALTDAEGKSVDLASLILKARGDAHSEG